MHTIRRGGRAAPTYYTYYTPVCFVFAVASSVTTQHLCTGNRAVVDYVARWPAAHTLLCRQRAPKHILRAHSLLPGAPRCGCTASYIQATAVRCSTICADGAAGPTAVQSGPLAPPASPQCGTADSNWQEYVGICAEHLRLFACPLGDAKSGRPVAFRHVGSQTTRCQTAGRVSCRQDAAHSLCNGLYRGACILGKQIR